MHFHAHVLFEPGCASVVERLRAQIALALGDRGTVGEYFDHPAGPLPKASFEVAYAQAQAAQVESVVEALCEGHSVFIHPVMEDETAAHTKFARWLGEPLPLRMGHL